ncbi:MAG: hypothetical protein KKA19_02985 [Candidatus Margulisbacteria bacterium]|nr:hypothetical protein [Candidatus Margulisiibacteriota bacterium]
MKIEKKIKDKISELENNQIARLENIAYQLHSKGAYGEEKRVWKKINRLYRSVERLINKIRALRIEDSLI